MLINDYNTVKHYIPNILKEVQGEASLFEKMRSHISAAESWLENNVLSSAVMEEIAQLDSNDRVRVVCENIIVLDAFYRAVPSLDLVMTPNGFGIVSNQNIAPASKERISRLLKSLLANKEGLLCELLKRLPSFSSWKESSVARFFASTLFPNLDICRVMGIEENLWTNYISLRMKIMDIEREMASHFVSTQQLEVFHAECMTSSYSGQHLLVINWLRGEIINRLKDIPPSCSLVQDVVNVMRCNPAEFSAWHQSEMPEVFSNKAFVNRKEYSAYWF